MSTEGLVGDLYRVGVNGLGWTGVTDEDKRRSGGQAELGADKFARAYCAVRNANDVAAKRGTGYWTRSPRLGGDGGVS